MPSCASWNGKWSGEGKKYVIVKDFKSQKAIEHAKEMLAKKNYYYNWSDGWGAEITVTEVDSQQAKQLRKESDGFCGYGWMVTTICDYGKPMADDEVREHLKSLTATGSPHQC